LSESIQEIISPNHLTLNEHVEIIRAKQHVIKEAFFDFVASINAAFNQLGQDIFENDLARELGMSASTLNRWKSIGSSKIIEQNRDAIPPVFSALYEITLLEKMYIKEKGEELGLPEVQKLINRGSIKPTTETKDIRFFVEQLRRELLEKKRQLKESILLEHSGSVGYNGNSEYSSLSDAVADGMKVRTIVVTPPSHILSKWSDPGFLKSQIHEEFPISELRGKSESESISCFLKVSNSRIDVAIKILAASGFSYRRTFFQVTSSSKDDVVVFGQRGIKRSIDDVSITDVVEIAKQVGSAPYLFLFGRCDADAWTSIVDPI